MPKPKAAVLKKVCVRCDEPFEVPDKTNYREKQYCTRACSNAATAAKRAETVRNAGRYQPPVCPCGKEVPPPPGANYIYANQKKFCSAECRMAYGTKRQKDPSKWVTFNCQNCGVEVERYKKLGMHKYCSNACAQKHTRKKQHVVVEDAIVLDSGFEVLFWGLCAFLKVPVERFDREQSIQLPSGHHYGPDFYLPGQDLYVEVKGFEDEDDCQRYAHWQVGHPIVVLDREKLDVLRRAPRAQFEEYMAEWSLISW